MSVACAVIVVCAAALGFVVPAHAATVRVDGSVVRFEAGTGEINAIALDWYLGQQATFTEPSGGALTPSSGCTRVEGLPTMVRCSGDLHEVRVNLGDGADTFETGQTGTGRAVIGGDGADKLRRWDLRIKFDGGPWDDDLSYAGVARGGDGADRLEYTRLGDGGPGNDLLLGRFDLRAGRVGRIALPLTLRGRGLVARRGCIAVRVAFELRGPDARRYGARRTLVVRRRGLRAAAP